jgi:serine/threonine protein kinase
MSSKLLSKGGFGCIFYPGITCKGHTKKDKNVVTKLQRRDFNSDNEILVGNLIKKIKNYKRYFLPVINNCSVNIRNIDSDEVKKCDIISSEKKFVVMDIPFVKNKNLISLLTERNTTNKQKLAFLLQTYLYLLNSIGLLAENDIIHFDLKLDNILIDYNSHIPYIIDFGISVPIKTISNENIKDYFYTFAPEYYVWCLDIIFINYILNDAIEYLDIKSIEYIVDSYIEFNRGLFIFSDEFKNLYRTACIKQLSKFIHLDNNQIIDFYMKFYKTWDNYSLSIIYLKIIHNLLSESNINNSHLISFVEILTLNIHPDPEKRLSIQQTREKFNNFILKSGDMQLYKQFANSFNFKDHESIANLKQDILDLNLTKNKYKKSNTIVIR